MIFAAGRSPPFAFSTTARVTVSASPSSNASRNRVALFFVPGDLPAGLPLTPLGNGLPRRR
jgi:hypothetical protein